MTDCIRANSNNPLEYSCRCDFHFKWNAAVFVQTEINFCPAMIPSPRAVPLYPVEVDPRNCIAYTKRILPVGCCQQLLNAHGIHRHHPFKGFVSSMRVVPECPGLPFQSISLDVLQVCNNCAGFHMPVRLAIFPLLDLQKIIPGDTILKCPGKIAHRTFAVWNASS